jgi:drug/metabolite transporter (DMT)-like permease
MTQCLAAPIGVLLAWAWHGTAPTTLHALAGLLILAGVAAALEPGHLDQPQGNFSAAGLGWGILAAMGQAAGQVLSRHGFQLAAAANAPADPGTVAYQRLFPGIAVGLVWFLIDSFYLRVPPRPAPKLIQAGPWLILNTLAGPTLGVAAYQWATKVAETSVVLSITAMTPLCVIPLAYWIDGERPTRWNLIGGAVAVTGVILLARA